MKQPLVSVIIPIYQVYEYLDECIESVVNQTYSELEIILVDDGTPDSCAARCDEWAEKDARISVIHKLNGGLSDARNYGMRIMCGGYVSYIDSDDYVSEEFFEVLLSTAIENDSDVVECGVIKVYENGEREEYCDDLAVSNYSASEGLSALINETPFRQHVWNKLFKNEVVKNTFFEVGKQHEDEFWTFQVFGEAKRITKITRTMYFYLQRGSSIMGNGYNLRRLDALEGKWNRRKYIEKHYPGLVLQAKLDFFGSCIYLLQCVLKYMSGKEKRQAISRIRKYKKMCGISFSDIKTVRSGVRKYYYFAKINLYLCCKMRAKFNIGF